jgi:hypothetical protein
MDLFEVCMITSWGQYHETSYARNLFCGLVGSAKLTHSVTVFFTAVICYYEPVL